MRLFTAESHVSRKTQTLSSSFLSTPSQSSSYSSLRSTPSHKTSSMGWSLLCSIVILNSFLALLSPSSGGGRALAAPETGFCGDCQTFSNAISVCGGSFAPADIEKEGEYVLQQAYAKCTCTAVMQKVLWACAKCEFFAGHGSLGVPPKKHQMTCMGTWGVTLADYNAPYTGVVAPGTTVDVGNGKPNPPPPPPGSSTTPPSPPLTPKPSGGGGNQTPSGGNGNGNGNGNNKPTTTDSNLPSSSQDSLNGDSGAHSNGINTTAIGISVGIIGVVAVAGVMTVMMMKRRRRRRSPLDLDSSPALANFVALEDKWETKANNGHNRPGSPPLPPVPVASASPVVVRGGGRGGYGEGSVVGGYDAQYDGQYDRYDAYGHHGGYDAYGHGQGQYGGGQYDHYGGQYDQGGYHPGQQDAYQMHDYGYDQHVVAASQAGPPRQPSQPKSQP